VDGKIFETIGNVKGKGTVQTKSYYGFEDKQPLTVKTLFRIKQVDLDGKEDYSVIVSFDPNKNVEPKVSVNAATQTIWFTQADAIKEIKVWGLNGQLIQTYKHISGNSVPFQNLQNGLYLIEINGIEGAQWMKKLLVQ
jgi:hypothetical protein